MSDTKALLHRFIGFKVKQFSLNEDAHLPEKMEDIKLYTAFTFLPYEPHHIEIIARFEFSSKQDETNHFIILELAGEFDIKEPDFQRIQNEKGDIILPHTYGLGVSAIVLGAARGYLHAKTEDTVFCKYQIPLMSLNEQFTSDILIAKKDK